MITEKDLQEAIAECQGQRNPNASTCIRLASYYALLDRMSGKSDATPNFPNYSFAAQPAEEPAIIRYRNDSEFADIINGMNANDVWPVIEELMDVLQTVNPKLYGGVIRRLRQASGER